MRETVWLVSPMRPLGQEESETAYGVIELDPASFVQLERLHATFELCADALRPLPLVELGVANMDAGLGLVRHFRPAHAFEPFEGVDAVLVQHAEPKRLPKPAPAGNRTVHLDREGFAWEALLRPGKTYVRTRRVRLDTLRQAFG